MRCASKTISEAAARMRAAGEQAIEESVAGVTSNPAADKQHATLNVPGARGHTRELLHP